MNSTARDTAEGDSASHHSHPLINKQPDPIDQPSRPLGVKRRALHARRQRQSIAAWRAGLAKSADTRTTAVLMSADGAIAFAVIRTTKGLMVERRHCSPAGLQFAQTMVFDSAAVFDQWCDLEPVRFEDPKLHAQLRREGHEALDAQR